MHWRSRYCQGGVIPCFLEYKVQRRAAGKIFIAATALRALYLILLVRQWTDLSVILPLILTGVFAIAFVLVELFIAPEPVLAPFLLKQKIPVLTGISNFLVSLCNFTVMYFFPTWFQTVALTSSSVAGQFVAPLIVYFRWWCFVRPQDCIWCLIVCLWALDRCLLGMCHLHSGSNMFLNASARWMMHRTGKYKMMNLTFGFLPFIAALLMTFMKPDSSPAIQWLSIVSRVLGLNGAILMLQASDTSRSR